MDEGVDVVFEGVSSSSSFRVVPFPFPNEDLTSKSQRILELSFSPSRCSADMEKLGNHETVIIVKEPPIKLSEESGGGGRNLDDWLPITESRNGNTFTPAFHLLCSGFGIQALLLPVAFISLGWIWGSLCLLMVFAWQLHTIWLLVHLHEPEPGTRYSRYLVLSIVAFGPKLGKFLAIFPTMYLSGGTCVMFIITGGATMELIHDLFCGDDLKCIASRLPGAIWFLIFICLAIFTSQLSPSLNSLARLSLIGSMAALVYFTVLWTVTIRKSRPDGVSHNPSMAASSETGRIRDVVNAFGIIAIAFRGHNVVLEIQGTLPEDPKHPIHRRMWRAVIASYLLIALCVFPLAIGGYWAYGNSMPAKGILYAIPKFHQESTMKPLMGAIYLIMLIHFISAFQIYAMPVFDNLERIYISKKNKACPRWTRAMIRVFFGVLTYFVSMAFPFLGSLGPFVGSLTLPLTLAYPCFMWIALKKPKPMGLMWSFYIGLGSLGILISVLLVAAALWNLVAKGLDANFFRPH